MLTRLRVRDFKGLAEAEIDLDNPVVFVGPNDSGKTSALQALTLWELGLKRWTAKRGESASPNRPGVAVNRRDVLAVPAPSARLFWRDLRVRNTYWDEGRRRTENYRIDITVEGVTDSEPWSCGLEFDYANEENIYCRPLRTSADGSARMEMPPRRLWPKMALLNPMSGLASSEVRLERGAIDVHIGEGRTAEVLRNLCYRVTELEDGKQRWDKLTSRIHSLFGVRLDPPRLIPDRGEVAMSYQTRSSVRLDLSSSGRGMLQTLLLLSFIELNRDSVLLLDEPDAHLEILRQRQVYQELRDTAGQNGTQVICTSHSEVILNEAARQDAVVAFVGRPHRVEKKAQVMKSLETIRFEDYYNAEITGLVLYVEGPSDVSLLLSFAEVLEHQAGQVLRRPFVRYVGNNLNMARSHFYGLREAKPDLVGYALFDYLDRQDLNSKGDLVEQSWTRREFENYLVPTKSLRRYAEHTGRASVGSRSAEGEISLFEEPEGRRWFQAMDSAIQFLTPPVALSDLGARFWVDTKMSDNYLTPVLERFFADMELPVMLRKRDYHHLIRFLQPGEVHQDVVRVLDGIASQANQARPGSAS